METTSCLSARNLTKKFKNFTLNIPEFSIPEGFATALIGENGAGKTTLLSILAGTRLDFQGELLFWGKYSGEDRDRMETRVRERTGFVAGTGYFMPHWKSDQIGHMSSCLFEGFHPERYAELLRELALTDANKKYSALSEGNKMKLALAAVFARDTDLLLLDEPASPLDPLMRDKLCDMIRAYLAEPGTDGCARSVLFSTHNIADMESVTDYVVIMEHGKIVESGFVEDLKEKYILVKGNADDTGVAKEILYTMNANSYGFEGVCLAKDLDRLAGMDVHTERATLTQIAVAVMKRNTSLVL